MVLTLHTFSPVQVVYASQVLGLYVQGFGSASATQVDTCIQFCEFFYDVASKRFHQLVYIKRILYVCQSVTLMCSKILKGTP